ncbi:hypothetical protein DRN46_02030, partial [Thermococci archaeon]
MLSLLLSATDFAEGKGCNIECMPENTCPTLNFNPDEIELEFDQFKCSEIQGIVLCTSTLTWVKEGRNPILHAWVVNTREDKEANLQRIVIEDGLSNYGVIELQVLRYLKPVGKELKELEYITRMILEEQEKLQKGEISLEEYQENVQRIRECYSERIGELKTKVEEGRYNTEILEFSPREWPNPGEDLLVRVVTEFELDGKELKLVKERRIRVASDFHEIWFEENHGRGKEEVKLQQAQGFWASGDTHLHSVITCDWYEVGFTFDHIEQAYRGNLDFTFITDHSYDVEDHSCVGDGEGDKCTGDIGCLVPPFICCSSDCFIDSSILCTHQSTFYRMASEDPIDGIDNDLDGLVDEDPEDILVNGKDIVDRDGDVYEFQMLKQECALRSDSEFLMIRGEEISAYDEGCGKGAQHYLALGINGVVDSKSGLLCPDIYAERPTAEEVIQLVQELGGLGFVAHPYETTEWWLPFFDWDWGYKGPSLAISNGVEALNSKFEWNIEYKGVKEFWEKFTRERGYRWTLLGGSDAHACNYLKMVLGSCPDWESLGTSFTVCYLEELTEEQVLSALREGRCFATNGPFLAIWGYDEGSRSPDWKLMSHETLYDYDNSLEIRVRYESDFALGEVKYLKIHWGIIGTNVHGTSTYYPDQEGWDPYSDSVEIEIPWNWSSIVPPGSPPETTVYLYAEIVTEEDPPSQIGEAYIAVTNMLFFQKGICCLEYPKRLSSSSKPETSCQDGEDAEFQFPITNCGNTQVKVDFSISKPPNWDIWMNIQDTDGDGKPDVYLDPGETTTLFVRVSPPFSALPSRTLIGMGLEVQDGICLYDSTLEVSVEEVKGILLSHTYPGRLYEVPLSEEMTQPHHLKLVNCGNVEEEIALRFPPEPGLIAWITDPFG